MQTVFVTNLMYFRSIFLNLRPHRMIGIDRLIPKVKLESEIEGLDQKLTLFEKSVKIKYKLYLGRI